MPDPGQSPGKAVSCFEKRETPSPEAVAARNETVSFATHREPP
jgi:hypothetical protein